MRCWRWPCKPLRRVTTTADLLDNDLSDGLCSTSANTCSLRAAIMQANHLTVSLTRIELPAGTYVLVRSPIGANGEESGDLNQPAPLASGQSIFIGGAGAATTIIDGSQSARRPFQAVSPPMQPYVSRISHDEQAMRNPASHFDLSARAGRSQSPAALVPVPTPVITPSGENAVVPKFPSCGRGSMGRCMSVSMQLPLWCLAILAAPAAQAVTPVVALERVSIATDGGQANGASFSSAISADGRYVVFDSGASNLTAAMQREPSAGPAAPLGFPTNVYVRDRLLGTTELISVAAGGGPANAACNNPTISADGRYVAFTSVASNIVAGDTNAFFDVFVRDRMLGKTVRASVVGDGPDLDGGGYGNGDYYMPTWMSANGRYVVFVSTKQLTANATTSTFHLYRRDLFAGTTELVSVTPGGMAVNNVSSGGALSADGRHVMFRSGATDIVPGVPSFTNVTLFVRDMLLGVTTSLTPNLSTPDLCWSISGDNKTYNLSANGRFAVFESLCRDIAPGQTLQDRLFMRDLATATTSVLHLAQGGAEDPQGGANFSVASSGRYVVARTAAALIPGDTNNLFDIYLRDRATAQTFRISERIDGSSADQSSYAPSMGTAGHIVFASAATNLVDGDTNGHRHIYVATLDPMFEGGFE